MVSKANKYPIKVKETQFGIDRNQLFYMLAENGISASVHYTPLHLLSYYRKSLGNQTGKFPVSEDIYKETLSLPLYPQLKYSDVQYVVENIVQAIE